MARRKGSLFYLPKLCHIIGKGVIWIGSREKGLQVKLVEGKFSLDAKTWMERRTVRIWRAGLHLSLRMSKQMRPSLSMFGW